MGSNQEFIASRQWSRGLQIGPLGRFSGWYLEQWAPKQQNSSLSSRGKIHHQGVESLNFTREQEKTNLCMFLNKLNSCKLTCFGPLLSFFVKMYQVILNQTLTNGKREKSEKRKNGKEELGGKEWKMYLKPQGQGGTCVFLTTQIINIFLFFFQYQYQYQYQNSQKVQYQYQNQYFGDANFNINIKINILKL